MAPPAGPSGCTSDGALSPAGEAMGAALPRPVSFLFGSSFFAAGVSTTRVQASIEETTAEKTKAREALIASADMAELLKLVGVDDTVEQAPTPAAPAAPATEE